MLWQQWLSSSEAAVGAHLVRKEAQVAIGGLVQRFGHLELQSDELAWGRSLFRLLGSLPVSVKS
jgi:cytochrome P450